MTKKILFLLWGGLFALCAGLGFVPEPAGLIRGIMSASALAFFLPPLCLLQRAQAEEDRATIKLLRNLAALSLGLTVVLLIGNFLAVRGSEFLGTALHYALVIISSPMICGGSWALSLFLWAVILIWSGQLLKC